MCAENAQLKEKASGHATELREAVLGKATAEAAHDNLKNSMEDKIELAKLKAKLESKDDVMKCYKEGLDRAAGRLSGTPSSASADSPWASGSSWA